MAVYTQAGRPLRVDTDLDEDVLLLEAFHGVEAISRPFGFELDLLSEDSGIAVADVLRSPMQITMQLENGEERTLHGRVNRFVQLGQSGDLTRYRAGIAPTLWFLSLVRECRIFQHLSVPEIVEKVFEPHGLTDYEIRCTRSYQPREYCVQYRESDLNFVSRLLEEEGIFYFHEHGDNKHVLVLGDDNSTFDPCPNKNVARAHSGGLVEEEVISSLQHQHQVYIGGVTLMDFDPLQPSLDLSHMVLTEDPGEHYDYPGIPSGVYEAAEVERYANLRMEAEEVGRQTLSGGSNCRAFTSGTRFELRDFYRRDANGQYVLTVVSHSATQEAYRSGGGAGLRYENQFQAIPMGTPFRPPAAARKPVVHGTQTAVVVGKAGEEVYTDEHGRIKIQFHWDRLGSRNEESSCWVRVATPWAGQGWGAVSIPRIGNEVIVDFLEGDPDRPIVVGSVYNAEQTPPFPLPASDVQVGMKTNTSPGGSGFNEISMTDTKGSELINIHAQKDMTTTVENDETLSVKANRSASVSGTQTMTVKGNATMNVTEGDYSHNVVKGKSDEYVKTKKGVKVDDEYSLEVKNNATITSTDGDVVVKSAKGTSTVDSKKNLTLVTPADIILDGKNVKSTAKAEVSVDGMKIALTGKTEVTLSVGGNFVKVDPSGVTIFGALVKIN